MKKGFIVLELMLVVFVGTLFGMAIHRGIIAVEYTPPSAERVVDCGDLPVNDEAGR